MLFCKKPGINEAVGECRNTPGAVLLDVRERDEFRTGHIPGAVNLPLSEIGTVSISKKAPLYVYCLRGTRSKRAVGILRRAGYENVRSIGGIVKYVGKLASEKEEGR